VRSARFVTALVTLALILGFGSSFAFVAPGSGDEYEVPLRSFDLYNYQSMSTQQGRASVENGLTRDLGGNWQVWSWNPQSATPHIVFGNAAYAPALEAERDLDAAALRLFSEQAARFGSAGAELHVTDRVHARGKWVAQLRQTYEGLEVWGAKAFAAFAEDGRLVAAGSDIYSDIHLSTVPGISAEQAEQIARMDLAFDPATDSMEGEPELIVLPVPLSEESVEHRLVWRLRLRTADPLGDWVTHVDAQNGDILWRYNDFHFALEGDSNSEVQPDSWCNGIENQPIPYLRVQVSGSGDVTTDSAGNWTSSASGSHSITSDLYGPYCNITNYGGPEAQFSGTAIEGSPLTISFDDLNAQHDERDAFNAVSDIHDFFQLFAPEFNLPNQRMNTHVSLNNTCNAYWDGSINFFREGGGCSNTGEIQGVVEHEYGHGVQAAILGWQGDQGLGEGNADILANLITQESVIGRGFYIGNCGGGIRDSDNDLSYPGDVLGQEVHYAGQVIAGFQWDILMGMEAVYGDAQGTIKSAEVWHYGRLMGHPTTQPDQVFWAFMADDDDGDLDNGTPHYSILCDAATHHGFDCPPILVGVLFDHTPLTDTGNDETPYPVSATIWSTEGAIDPATATIFYRRNGEPWSSVGMTTMDGSYFFGEIPAQSTGKIDYYLYAEDEAGTTGTSPWGGPDVFYSFYVAWRFEDMEVDNGWTVGAPDDNADQGIWERVDPVGTSAQPEDDHSEPGTICWVTGQHEPGQPDDYDDVGYGKTTLFSPVYDLSQASEVYISYWRWFYGGTGDEWKSWVSNDGGATWVALETDPNPMLMWTPYGFDLFDYFAEPGQVQLKFHCKDGVLNSLVEGALDDLMIHAVIGGTGVGDGFSIGVPLRLEQNMPNPFNPSTEIKFALESAGRVDLKVFEVGGRLVKTLVAGDLSAGEHRVLWDGRDQGGRLVGSGVYLYRLSAGGEVKSRTMVLIK